MLPFDLDTRIVWRAFVIKFHHLSYSATLISIEARRKHMPMTREDVLEILREYADAFDDDVRLSRGK